MEQIGKTRACGAQPFSLEGMVCRGFQTDVIRRIQISCHGSHGNNNHNNNNHNHSMKSEQGPPQKSIRQWHVHVLTWDVRCGIRTIVGHMATSMAGCWTHS